MNLELCKTGEEKMKPTCIPGIGVTKNSREYEEEFSLTE